MVTQALHLEDESNVSDVTPLPQSELEVVGSANQALPNIFTSLSQAKLYRLMLTELLYNPNDVNDANFRKLIEYLLATDAKNLDGIEDQHSEISQAMTEAETNITMSTKYTRS